MTKTSYYFDDYYDRLPIGARYELYEEPEEYEEYDKSWKRIEGFPLYFVSIYGDVMSIVNHRPHILKTWTNRYGHHYVQLRSVYGRKKLLVHRLVAEAFIPNPDNYPIVRHLDDDPDNNCVDNLAWGTQSDNMADCLRHGRNYHKRVYCYELDRFFDSCADAARYFNVSKSIITLCCKEKCHSILGGYHLCHEEDLKDRLSDVERWTWKRGNYKRVLAINTVTGEEILFVSRQEASEELGIPDSYISNIIHGRAEKTRDWTFVDMEGKYD